MAVGLRERPAVTGEDAQRFLMEEKKVDERRAQLIREGRYPQPGNGKNQKTICICLTK